MLTDREQEIFQWIEENPLISQNELAERAGITRSSVAVHISNLMKKGFIQGKGYVLSKAPYAVVVGGANIDITGYANRHLDPEDSTPGRVEVLLGGVGRNQAHNLRLLGVDVRLITMFGDDLYGEKIKQSCRDIGIDITESITLSTGATSTYVSIVDADGKLQMGISAMDIYEQLTSAVISTKMDVVNKAAVCVADTNIPEETLHYLAENCRIPLFVETISSAKVSKITGILNKIHTLKTDRTEIQHLMGYELSDSKSVEKALGELLRGGVGNIYMNYSSSKVICANNDKIISLPYYTAQAENKNGARDSFMAALVWSYLNGLGFEEASRTGVAAASICAASKHVVNERLNVEYMLNVVNGKESVTVSG